jgi:glycosyltransferase involved in cell wall biosynthesis
MFPMVTIGMPVYNGEAYLSRTLDSLLEQEWRDFELIISDNASTDRTSEIIADRAVADDRVRAVRQPTNLGVGPNFRYVLAQATGEYFMWAAHDDVWEPGFLTALLACMGDPEVVLAFPGSDLLSRTGERHSYPLHALPTLRAGARCFETITELLAHPHPAMAYGLFRTAALRRTRSLHGALYDFSDLGLLTEIAIEGEIRIAPGILFHSGIKGEERVPWSVADKRLPGFRFSYWPYLWRSTAVLMRAGRLTYGERLRLVRMVLAQVMGLIAWHESLPQPAKRLLELAGRAIVPGGVRAYAERRLRRAARTSTD